MEKKDVSISINTAELNLLDPNTKKLILDIRRHFNGIIYAIVRWNLAKQVKKTS